MAKRASRSEASYRIDLSLPQLKSSFEPISNQDTRILILGSLPGDKSIEVSEYYGHPRNRFWSIISAITGFELPASYAAKKAFLHEIKVGVWDVVQHAHRAGSLDSAIQNEQPNDLVGFMAEHQQLRIIAFNGGKAQALYDKYFERKARLKYIKLPSSSPANAGISYDQICKAWRLMLSEDAS